MAHRGMALLVDAAEGCEASSPHAAEGCEASSPPDPALGLPPFTAVSTESVSTESKTKTVSGCLMMSHWISLVDLAMSCDHMGLWGAASWMLRAGAVHI